MADLGFVFNTEEVPESIFEPIPAGDYKALITESEMKTTKSRTGEYLELKIEITEGEHAGRTFFERLNIKNPNEKAVEIAYQTLAKICKAVNKNNIQRSEELHNIRFFLSVGVEVNPPYQKADGTMSESGFKNSIKGYKSILNYTPTATTPTTGQQQAVAPTTPTATKSLPWKK